jgi:hypothetical protein
MCEDAERGSSQARVHPGISIRLRNVALLKTFSRAQAQDNIRCAPEELAGVRILVISSYLHFQTSTLLSLKPRLSIKS